MSYVKNTWVDQVVARPKTYQVTENQDGSITLTDDFGLITEIGTPVDQAHMNHIENGIEGVDVKVGELSNLTTTDKTSIVNAINSVLQVDDDRFHACKGYEDAGELLTDAEGLADVIKYAHSTFDENKFDKFGNDITITTDGIASGFGSGNYLKIGSTINATNQIIIKERVIWASGIGQGLCSGYYSGNSEAFICFTGDNNLNLRLHDDGSTLLTVPFSANANDIVDILIQITASTMTLSVSVNGGTPVTNTRENPIVSFDLSGVSYYIGSTYVGTAPTLGQIDLKYMTIYDTANNFFGTQTGTDTYTIGGSTVTIPYSLSKTGSKVVMHEAYRSSVSSVYNAFGVAPYYTLNVTDTNFTIPQGEIYGMMMNVVERYNNGDSWYRVWADGWCEQGGVHSGTTGTEQTINLLKNYKDTKYFVTYNNEGAEATYIVIKNKLTSSFGIRCFTTEGNHSGDQRWYACGYIR